MAILQIIDIFVIRHFFKISFLNDLKKNSHLKVSLVRGLHFKDCILKKMHQIVKARGKIVLEADPWVFVSSAFFQQP